MLNKLNKLGVRVRGWRVGTRDSRGRHKAAESREVTAARRHFHFLCDVVADLYRRKFRLGERAAERLKRLLRGRNRMSCHCMAVKRLSDIVTIRCDFLNVLTLSNLCCVLVLPVQVHLYRLPDAILADYAA